MIKAREFPGRSYETKEDLFQDLKKNEARLIDIKKSEIHKSCDKGQISFLNAEKAFENAEIKNFRAKQGYIYPIISTTNYRDSHKDVHFNGCFNKTVKEQQGKVVYALDHELKYDSILAWQKDIRMFKASIDWALVGKDYEGETEALVFEINKSAFARKDVLQAIEDKVSDFENSIRMVYHKLKLGINSENKEYAENKAYFDSKIDLIANKDAVLDDGYFWGVEELAIYKEGSLVVSGGSNDATSIYEKLEADPVTSTKQEPEKSTQAQSYYSGFIN